jgi:hypothetical protein
MPASLPIHHFERTGLTGGAEGDLDGIDGNYLAEGYTCRVTVLGVAYDYWLNATSGAAESSPAIISPDTNAGNKRWILHGVNVATLTLNGGQIVFPATQSPSANANTLDDYEENTWPPSFTNLTVVNGTGGATYSGTYTKIGRLVFFTAQITVTGDCTTAGTAAVTYHTLPFTPAVFGASVAADIVANGLGMGLIHTNGNNYPPAWSARNTGITISGVFSV